LGLEVICVKENLAVPAPSVVARTAATHCAGDSGEDLCAAIPSAAPAVPPTATRAIKSHGTKRRTWRILPQG